MPRPIPTMMHNGRFVIPYQVSGILIIGMDRRRFLAALTSSSAAALAAKKPDFNKPLAVQLYTVRSILPNDMEGVIKSIAQIGYKEAEVLQAHIDQIMPILKANGMTAPSGHFDAGLITGSAKTGTWDQAVESAKKHGLEYMVMPYIAPNERGTADFYRSLAEKMNRAAEATTKAGMTFCYHNHAFEFAGKEGERPWDVLVNGWDKKLVNLEVDLFWVSVAGNTPSEFLRRYAGRVPLVHLKDKAFGTPVQFTEQVEPKAFMEVGTGTLDYKAILKACEAAGVKHYIVEQDQTKGNPIDSLRLSYNNIRAMKLKG
jgi:sugar phosphate isomerase/epimerase